MFECTAQVRAVHTEEEYEGVGYSKGKISEFTPLSMVSGAGGFKQILGRNQSYNLGVNLETYDPKI